MFITDIISMLSFEITPFKNKLCRGYKHLAPDGSGWKDTKFKNGEIKRKIIKGKQYNELQTIIDRMMASNKMC
jgi:hypothetical protein